MKLRLHLTIADEWGTDEALEQLLEGFVNTRPDVGPVVGQDKAAGTLSVVVTFDAEGVEDATAKATDIVTVGIKAAGLPSRLVNLDVSVVEDDAGTRELQPA